MIIENIQILRFYDCKDLFFSYTFLKYKKCEILVITNYSIENFKVFSEKNSFKFAPITLIYGPNSSGKSSIIQSLIVLKESVLKNNNINGLRSNNNFFELGSYASVVNGHDIRKNIKYEISNEEDEFKFEYAYKSLAEKSFSYVYSIIIEDKKNILKKWSLVPKHSENQLGLQTFNVDFDKNLLDFYSKNHESIKYFYRTFDNNDLKKSVNNENIYNYLKKLTLSKKIFALPYSFRNSVNTKEGDSMEQKIESFYLNSFTEALSSDLRKKDRIIYDILNKISYIGPLRPHPKRVYQLDDVLTSTVGQKGENFLSFLARDDKYVKAVNGVLESFNIKYDIEIFRTNNDVIGDTVSILLVDRKSGLKTTLVDVGFGIGQVLPIILEGLVKSRSTICIEQPEIHLHPKLQADLANFFVQDIKSSRGNQWVIETHSESLLLRIQRLVRHKILTPKDISIIYVDPTEEGVKTIHIPLDEDGDFMVEWPNGFFEERVDEMFGGNPLEEDSK